MLYVLCYIYYAIFIMLYFLCYVYYAIFLRYVLCLYHGDVFSVDCIYRSCIELSPQNTRHPRHAKMGTCKIGSFNGSIAVACKNCDSNIELNLKADGLGFRYNHGKLKYNLKYIYYV